MDLEIMASDISQTGNDKYHLYAKYKTSVPMNLFTNKNRITDTENKPVITKRESRGVGR